MDYGTQISKPGCSLGDIDAPPKDSGLKPDITKEMVSGLGLAFLLGATEQVKRYKEAYSRVKSNPQVGVMLCLHEALTLLEDLDTISWYT